MDIQETVQCWTCFVLCPKKRCLVLLFYALPIVTGVIYLYRFEEFHMPILEVSWWYSVPTRWSTSTFPWRNDTLPKLQVSREIDWWMWACQLSTKFPDLRGTSRMLCTCHRWLPLAIISQQDKNCSVSVTLNLLKDMWTETEYWYKCWATFSALIEHL